MSNLKSSYVEKIRRDSTQLEKSSFYISDLALQGGIEIDNYLQGRNNKFEHVQELTEILERYQLSDTDTHLFGFSYMCLWKTMRVDSDKEVRYCSELAIEMNLLRFELRDIPNNYKKLEELRDLLCNFTINLVNERSMNKVSHRF